MWSYGWIIPKSLNPISTDPMNPTSPAVFHSPRLSVACGGSSARPSAGLLDSLPQLLPRVDIQTTKLTSGFQISKKKYMAFMNLIYYGMNYISIISSHQWHEGNYMKCLVAYDCVPCTRKPSMLIEMYPFGIRPWKWGGVREREMERERERDSEFW